MSEQPEIDIPTERMTVEEFRKWDETQPIGRFELEDGYVIRMQAENNRHNLCKSAMLIATTNAVRRAGLDCTVLGDGCSIRIDDWTVFEPDMTLQCNAPVDPDSLEATRPVLLVEVMSKSTSHIDMGRKMSAYFSLPSVQHYLVVDAKKKLVLHHRRNGDEVATRFVREGDLSLGFLNLTIDIGELWVG